MICTSCGAAALPGSGSFCSHCGRRIGEVASEAALPTAMVVTGGRSALASPEVDAETLPVPPSSHGDRFALARCDPAYASALVTPVAAPRGGELAMVIGPIAMMVFGAVFAAIWFTIAPIAFKIFGALFFVLWFGMLGAFTRKGWRQYQAPVQAQLAVVVGRTQTVSHHRDDDGSDRTSVHQHVTLELEDGRRLALGGADRVLLAVVEDDCGVAHVKGDRLIGFQRLAG